MTKPGESAPSTPPVEPVKVITPDASALISKLEADVADLKKDRSGWQEKAAALETQLKELIAKPVTPEPVKQRAGFAAWDLFFGTEE